MKALSIRQPWAWLIANGYKPVENRTWNTNFRGQFLIHAAQKFDRNGFMWVIANTEVGPDMPSMWDFEKEPGYRGGIVGIATLYDTSTIAQGAPLEAWSDPKTAGFLRNPKEWFFGPQGFWVRDAKPLPFRALPGRLGFFEVAAP